MFQVSVDALVLVIDSLSKHHWPLYRPQRTVWRRTGDRETGQREIFVQDPDGYLIMIAEAIGERRNGVATAGRDDE